MKLVIKWTLYKKDKLIQSENTPQPIIRKSPKVKYQIFDELEFTRGREVLGELIVHGMMQQAEQTLTG